MPGVDQTRFEREMLVHLDCIYRTARRLTGNDRDAEDLAQETMLRAYRFFHQYTPGTNARAWLMRILHNLHINFVNRRNRSPVTAPVELHPDAIDDDAPGPEAQLLSQVWDERVLDALGRLPLDYRTVVVLCDVEEMAYKDIAEALGIPIGTVRSRLSRGRRLLASMLAGLLR